MIEVAEMTTGTDLGNELLTRVQRDIRDLGGTDRYAPGMRLGYTGDVAIDVEEMAALVQDLTASSLVVIALVLGVILFFYRWWRSVPALLLPLGIGAVYAFALVTLPPISIAHLNSNTAFLGSVIGGNGMNFGIILLSRGYVEERRRGVEIERALVLAVWGSLRRNARRRAGGGRRIWLALALTQFRGFKHLIIGGIGMLVCWASAYLLGFLPLHRVARSQRFEHLCPWEVAAAVHAEALANLITRHPAPSSSERSH